MVIGHCEREPGAAGVERPGRFDRERIGRIRPRRKIGRVWRPADFDVELVIEPCRHVEPPRGASRGRVDLQLALHLGRQFHRRIRAGRQRRGAHRRPGVGLPVQLVVHAGRDRQPLVAHERQVPSLRASVLLDERFGERAALVPVHEVRHAHLAADVGQRALLRGERANVVPRQRALVRGRSARLPDFDLPLVVEAIEPEGRERLRGERLRGLLKRHALADVHGHLEVGRVPGAQDGAGEHERAVRRGPRLKRRDASVHREQVPKDVRRAFDQRPGAPRVRSRSVVSVALERGVERAVERVDGRNGLPDRVRLDAVEVRGRGPPADAPPGDRVHRRHQFVARRLHGCVQHEPVDARLVTRAAREVHAQGDRVAGRAAVAERPVVHAKRPVLVPPVRVIRAADDKRRRARAHGRNGRTGRSRVAPVQANVVRVRRVARHARDDRHGADLPEARRARQVHVELGLPGPLVERRVARFVRKIERAPRVQRGVVPDPGAHVHRDDRVGNGQRIVVHVRVGRGRERFGDARGCHRAQEAVRPGHEQARRVGRPVQVRDRMGCRQKADLGSAGARVADHQRNDAARAARVLKVRFQSEAGERGAKRGARVRAVHDRHGRPLGPLGRIGKARLVHCKRWDRLGPRAVLERGEAHAVVARVDVVDHASEHLRGGLRGHRAVPHVQRYGRVLELVRVQRGVDARAERRIDALGEREAGRNRPRPRP